MAATTTLNLPLYRVLRELGADEAGAREAAEAAAGPDLSHLATADALREVRAEVREVRAELKAEIAAGAKAFEERIGRAEDRLGRAVAEAAARQTAWFGALVGIGLGAATFLWPPTRFAQTPPAVVPPPAASAPAPSAPSPAPSAPPTAPAPGTPAP